MSESEYHKMFATRLWSVLIMNSCCSGVPGCTWLAYHQLTGKLSWSGRPEPSCPVRGTSGYLFLPARSSAGQPRKNDRFWVSPPLWIKRPPQILWIEFPTWGPIFLQFTPHGAILKQASKLIVWNVREDMVWPFCWNAYWRTLNCCKVILQSKWLF